MKFIEVKGIRPIRGRMHRMQVEVETFMSMNIKMAKIDYVECEYKNPMACYKSFWTAVRRYAMPIQVTMIDGEVYLIRKDM